MGISEQNEVAEKFHYNEEDECDTEESDSDDSQEDPSFDFVDENRSRFSRLSTKKKSESRIIKETVEGNEEVPDELEMVVPELGEEDQKSFEVVQKIIEAGQVEKLKVDQCKVYLRKHGLRLMGNKDTLIERIKEHLDILKGDGRKKYPISSFVLNCKGDACTGDVIMFEQNVYEMFNIASRSASGPSCGKRIVAGRIVKESYGAAKQQHTFTIEVLWSEGEKPLPPLYPLLIKGRNLYRLKTVRQRWENEGERQKMLSEKHARGSLARSNRETRIQLKEMKKILNANRASRMEDQKGTKVEPFQSLSIGSEKLVSQPQEQQKNKQKSHQEQKMQQKECRYSKTCKENITSVPLETLHRQPGFFPKVNVPSESIIQWQHLTSMPSRIPLQSQNHEQILKSVPSQCLFQRQSHEQSTNGNPFRRPLTNLNCSIRTESKDPYSFPSFPVSTSLPGSHNHEQSMNFNPLRNPFQRQGLEQSLNPNSLRHAHKENTSFSPIKIPVQRQPCRFYAQGRCYHGDQCKYLHEYRGNQNYGQRKDERNRSDLRYY